MKTEPTQQEINLIQNFFNQGKLDDAIQTAEQLITKYPESYVVWNLLAVCASRAKNRIIAAKYLEKAIQINPHYPEAHYNLGALAMAEGDLEAALFSFAKAVALRPNYSEAYINMSVLLKKKGDLVEAIKAQRSAISINPNIVKDQVLPFEVKAMSYQKAEHLKSTYTELNDYGSSKLISLKKSDQTYSLAFNLEHQRSPKTLKIENAKILGQSNIILNKKSQFSFENIVFNGRNADKILNLRDAPFYDLKKQEYYYCEEASIKSGIFIGTHWNFGHWIFNHVARLFFVSEDIWRNSNVIVSDSLNDNYASVLMELGIPTENIIRVKTSQILHVEDLLVPQMAWLQAENLQYMAPDCLPWLRKQLGVNENTDTIENKKVFLTRKNANHRRVINEWELYEIAESFGFELVDIGSLTTKEQLVLGQKTSHFVTPMGANSTFFLYTRNNTKMLELSLPIYKMNIMRAFAEASSVKYSSIIGTEIKNKTDSAIDADYYIDPLKFTQELQNLMD